MSSTDQYALDSINPKPKQPFVIEDGDAWIGKDAVSSCPALSRPDYR